MSPGGRPRSRLARLLGGTGRGEDRPQRGGSQGGSHGDGREVDRGDEPPALARARELSQARRWEEAAAAWADAERQGPQPAPAAVFHGLAQASRMARDHDEAARACERGRRDHPDHPGLLVEDARISLYHHRRASEDRQHAWRRRLLDVDARLRALEAAGAAPREAEVVLAELATGLGRPDAAVRWADIAAHHPRRRASARLRQAQAHRGAGELEAARAALEQIPASERRTGKVARELAGLDTSLRRWSSIELGRQARLRYRVEEVDDALDQLRLALRLRGDGQIVAHAAPVIEAVGEVLRGTSPTAATSPPAALGPAHTRAGTPDTAPAADTEPEGHRPIDPPRTIHVCGLLYSGSGAVFDHLRTHPGLDVPFGSRELGFLKRPHNLATLVDLAEEQDPEGFAPALADAVLTSVLGLGQSGRGLVELVDTQVVPDLLAAAHRLVVRLGDASEDAKPSPTTLRSAVRGFIDEVMALAAGHPGAKVLLNNAVLANQLDRLELFSSAQAVAVLRDPRDQYVSQRLEYAFPLELDAFVTTMRTRLEELATLRDSGAVRERVRCVAFEDYVTDAERRAEVVAWLGLAPTDWEVDPEVFDPSRSRTNIGIHRDHHDRAEIARIHAELGELYAHLVG